MIKTKTQEIMHTILEITTIQTTETTQRQKAQGRIGIPPKMGITPTIKTQIGIVDTHITHIRSSRYFEVQGGQAFNIIKL